MINQNIKPSDYALNEVGLTKDQVIGIYRPSSCYKQCKKCVFYNICRDKLSYMDMMCHPNQRGDFFAVYWELKGEKS
jgi:hypothetical protein